VGETWEKALAARNRLAHSYFWSQFKKLSASEAHEDLIGGLRKDATLFKEAAEATRNLVEQLIPSLGIEAGTWRAALQEEFARLRDGA
jgi:hypothetical protein